MDNVKVTNDALIFDVTIDGLRHLFVDLNKTNGFHSYIDDDTNPLNYYIEFYLDSGQTIKAQYQDRELWETILKGL